MDFWFRRGVRCFRTGIGAYPSAICEERTTKSEAKRHAALRVAPLLGSGFVAPRSQPHFGGCSLVAPRQNPKSVQPMYSYLGDTTLVGLIAATPTPGPQRTNSKFSILPAGADQGPG